MLDTAVLLTLTLMWLVIVPTPTPLALWNVIQRQSKLAKAAE